MHVFMCCYIMVLHHVRHLEPIWICAVQIPFWMTDWNSSGRVIRPGESLDQESLHAVWHQSMCAFLMFKIVSWSQYAAAWVAGVRIEIEWKTAMGIYFLFHPFLSASLVRFPSRSPKLPWFSIWIPKVTLPWFSIKIPKVTLVLHQDPQSYPGSP